MIKKVTMNAVLSILMVTFISTLGAQTITPSQQGEGGKVTDAQLKKFVRVSNDFQKMQKDNRTKQQNIIKNNDMTVQRFNEISKAKRSGKDAQMTEAEKKKFDKISKALKEFQKSNQKKAQQILQKHSMSQNAFMKIRRKLQSDKELQKRFSKLRSQM
jgi:hypothetical protein